MKTATPALISLLASASTYAMADLLTLTPPGSPPLRLTNADQDLVWNGNTFSSTGVLFKRGATRVTRGLEVDTLSLTLMGNLSTLVYGAALIPFAVRGGFDGARVLLERAVLPDWASPIAGVVHLFSGRVSDAPATREEIRMTVKSELELLTTKQPHNLYQAGCANTLFDGGCGLLAANFTSTGTVQAGSSTTQIKVSLSQATGHFDLGTIRFTSGANAGQVRTVKRYASGAVDLILPLPNAPAVGDAYAMVAGCNKTLATCTTKFNNKARFRGFPFLPTQETLTGKPAVGEPVRGGGGGGGSNVRQTVALH